jgi:hypothetical protein
MGDLNARVGCPKNAFEEGLIGKFGEQHRSKNGERLMDLLAQADMVSASGRKAESDVVDCAYEYTRYDKRTDSYTVIDYALVAAKMVRRVQSCEVDYKDLGLDHKMVVINLACASDLPRPEPIKRIKYHTQKLLPATSKEEDREEAPGQR